MTADTRGPRPGALSARKVPTRTRLDFWFDAVLLIAYTLAYSFGFTGQAIHEWLGLALGAALLLHLTMHWDWVTSSIRALFAHQSRRRLLLAVNLALLVGMTLCVMSGIYVSGVALPALSIPNPGGGGAFPFWKLLHHLTAEATLGLVAVHVALDWRWVVAVARRLPGRQARRRPR